VRTRTIREAIASVGDNVVRLDDADAEAQIAETMRAPCENQEVLVASVASVFLFVGAPSHKYQIE
jgi:hypothetical protein